MSRQSRQPRQLSFALHRPTKKCQGCGKELDKSNFSKKQWKKRGRCKSCSGAVNNDDGNFLVNMFGDDWLSIVLPHIIGDRAKVERVKRALPINNEDQMANVLLEEHYNEERNCKAKNEKNACEEKIKKCEHEILFNSNEVKELKFQLHSRLNKLLKVLYDDGSSVSNLEENLLSLHRVIDEYEPTLIKCQRTVDTQRVLLDDIGEQINNLDEDIVSLEKQKTQIVKKKRYENIVSHLLPSMSVRSVTLIVISYMECCQHVIHGPLLSCVCEMRHICRYCCSR